MAHRLGRVGHPSGLVLPLVLWGGRSSGLCLGKGVWVRWLMVWGRGEEGGTDQVAHGPGVKGMGGIRWLMSHPNPF